MAGTTRFRMRILHGAALSAFVLLAACGGGGGDGVKSTPTPTPTPAPTPTPEPTPTPTPTPSPTPTPTPTPMGSPPPPVLVPTEFDTPEFRASNGAVFHNAVAAWKENKTGAGQTIAIVDTGINTASPEFGSRITMSEDFAVPVGSTRASGDTGGNHGTQVAMVAAGARNGSGTLGIAYAANILALRADKMDSCGSCQFDAGPVTNAVRFAADNGAKVINISMAYSTAMPGMNAAVAYAVGKGAIIVVAAGNDRAASPSAFVTDIQSAGGANVIVAGSVDANGNISYFSTRAGSTMNVYLAALGEGLIDPLNSGATISGTSFSAPQISGAIALLAQAFPTKTGAELVDILLRTAHDAGAAGTDAIYGRGILNIAAAMQPVGTATVAGTGNVVPLNSLSGVGSEAMGDALASSASLETIILDEYQRAFSMDLGRGMRNATLVPRLHNALSGETRMMAGASEKASLAFTVRANGAGGVQVWPEALRLSQDDARQAQVLAARVALRLSPGTQVAFGFADSANGLAAQMRGAQSPAFFVAQDATTEEGFHADDRVSLALRRQLGPWGLTVGAESGRIVSGAPLVLDQTRGGDRTRDGMSRFGVVLDRHWGAVDMAFGASWLNENRTVLGARFSEAFGGKGADSVTLDGRVGWQFAPSWRLAGAWRESWTMARSTGLIADGSQLRSRAWSIDLSRNRVFGQSDSIALRIAQPMRVEKGQLRLDMPVSYDYATQTAGFGTRALNLAPNGREIMGELAWSGRLFAGWASASVFYRRDPGHYAQLPDDKGVALRWTTGF